MRFRCTTRGKAKSDCNSPHVGLELFHLGARLEALLSAGREEVRRLPLLFFLMGDLFFYLFNTMRCVILARL